MAYMETYCIQSLELHLFFARIMKEHALFLEAAFTPAQADLAKKADNCKREFESLLMQAVKLSDGIIGEDVLCSGEIVTEYTYGAEQQTACFTGIEIDKRITKLEQQLCYCTENHKRCIQSGMVEKLNHTALQHLNSLIRLKETILSQVQSCQMFTTNYPLLIKHTLREAKMYRNCIQNLENGKLLNQNMMKTEQFWNQIMMEHALFMRGLLDPSEEALIKTADEFAHSYEELLEECSEKAEYLEMSVLEKTKEFRDFNAAGAKGIQDCKIQSIILPLLADHVLREANHYIRLLEK